MRPLPPGGPRRRGHAAAEARARGPWLRRATSTMRRRSRRWSRSMPRPGSPMFPTVARASAPGLLTLPPKPNTPTWRKRRSAASCCWATSSDAELDQARTECRRQQRPRPDRARPPDAPDRGCRRRQYPPRVGRRAESLVRIHAAGRSGARAAARLPDARVLRATGFTARACTELPEAAPAGARSIRRRRRPCRRCRPRRPGAAAPRPRCLPPAPSARLP